MCGVQPCAANTTSQMTGIAAAPAQVAGVAGGGTTPPATDSSATIMSALGSLTNALSQLVQAVTLLMQSVQRSSALPTQAGGATAGGATSNGTTTTSAPAAGSQAAQPPRPPATSNARPGVLMIGDSLSVGTKQYFNDGLAGQPTEVNATGGISLQEGMRRYDATPNKPRVVAMGLFTNNDPGQTQVLRESIQKTIDDARARGGRVIWSTIVRPAVGGKTYDEANRIIRDLASQNSDVMGLVDWDAMIKANPSYLAGDKIHATAEGYKARAQAYADAART